MNNCIFFLGRYLDSFKTTLNYNIIRVSTNEFSDSTEVSKEEQSNDYYNKYYKELQILGYIASNLPEPAIIQENISTSKDKAKDNKVNSLSGNPPISDTFFSDLNQIEEKVKLECSKVYTGEYLKLIQNNEKMPTHLNSYLKKSKEELHNFRLKSIRILRTHSQNLFSISIKIGKIVNEFISLFYLDKINTFIKECESNFFEKLKQNNDIKSNINSKLGPYLANPYYMSELDKLKNTELNRNKDFSEILNQTQLKILIEIEIQSDLFYKRLLNNYETFILLFDNFIFEEEYIALGDSEDLKTSFNYNTLLKLKEYNQEVNLDSKRSLKKIYYGLNKQLLRLNYFDRFNEFAKAVIDGYNDKQSILSTEFTKNLENKPINCYSLINNKNLTTYRNNVFERFVNKFNQYITYVLDNYDLKILEENNYSKYWNNSIQDLFN